MTFLLSQSQIFLLTFLRKIILKTSAEDSLNLLVASDELELIDLAEIAQKHLIREFSSWLFSNIVVSLNVVCRHNHFHDLYNRILTFTFRCPYSLFDSTNLSLLDEVAMICLLESDDLELEEIEIWNYLIKWGISKILDDDITNWSDENVLNWTDEHFMALKETISRPTIVILKTIQGDLIGGYNPLNWGSFTNKIDGLNIDDFIRLRNSNGFLSKFLPFIFSTKPYFTLEKKPYFSKTSNSFIFSFTNQFNPVLSRIKTEGINEAIWNSESCGPSFGESDLCMKESNYWFTCCFWETYEHKITNTNVLIAEEYEVLAFDNYNLMMNNI
ncbi:30184_t:CDS:2, partial [Gigaspora margarita]